MKIETRIAALVAALSKGLYEREEVVKLSLLAAIAGESIFLLGPPGVGKSLIARRLKHAFTSSKTFEYLMTRFSTPDEIFGPVSIKKLKDEDLYERKTEKYLPGAQVVFLDEIWKSSSAIQNALLTILNERVYRNGEQEMEVAIHAIITASNELPASDDGLAALYDRFLIRYEMTAVKKTHNFLKMITDTEDVYSDSVPAALKVTPEELATWSKAIQEVKVEQTVLNTIQMLREKIQQWNEKQGKGKPIEVLDRRWKKIIRILRTSAFLNGRDAVDLMDCFLLVHTIWDHPSQFEEVSKLVAEVIQNHGYSVTVGLQPLRKEIDAFETEVNNEVNVPLKETEPVLKPYEENYYKVLTTTQHFEGQFITVKQYNQLIRGEEGVFNFYDEQFKLVNRLVTAKGEGQFTIQVKHNSVVHELTLETYLKEKTRMLFKAPHPLVAAAWTKQYDTLKNYIAEQEHLLASKKPHELNQGDSHVFIDNRLAPFVAANFEAVVKALKQLDLRLDKIQHLWERQT